VDERSRLLGRQPVLVVRAAILRAVRAYFEGQGFVEVETPSRVYAPGQEIHLDAIPAGRDRRGERFLITSPEYHMKRLVASGLPRIVQFCRCFRAEEAGPFHQPEFTMIEWYRANGTMGELMQDCEALVEAAARVAGTWPCADVPATRRGSHGAEAMPLGGGFQRTTVRELLRQHAGIQLRGDETEAEMRALAASAGCQVTADAAWDDCFYQVFLDRIEPHLGSSRPTFVSDWPLPLAALARRKPGELLTAERFELYAAGIELANAFGELTDSVEQRRRFEEESAIRGARGKTVYPLDEQLLGALEHMPPTCGIALGFDRLVMLVTGAESIRDVMAFADDEV